MPTPITPFVACDTFILNEKHDVLLIKRADSDTWALPGGYHDLDETAAECAARECLEETGYEVKITGLLGTFSTQNYEQKYSPYKDNQIVNMLFRGHIIGGSPQTSEESLEIAWFKEDELPTLFDGHTIRIKHGFAKADQTCNAHFE